MNSEIIRLISENIIWKWFINIDNNKFLYREYYFTIIYFSGSTMQLKLWSNEEYEEWCYYFKTIITQLII